MSTTTTKKPKIETGALPPEIETIESLLAEHDRLEKRSAAAEALQAKLEPEIKALCLSTDLDDDHGFEALARKKLQLEIIPRQLEEIERRCEELDAELKAPSMACLKQVAGTLQTIQAGLAELGGRAMRDHFPTLEAARLAALAGPKPTAAAFRERTFGEFYNNSARDPQPWVRAARYIVRSAEDIRRFDEERAELERQLPEGIPSLQEIYR